MERVTLQRVSLNRARLYRVALGDRRKRKQGGHEVEYGNLALEDGGLFMLEDGGAIVLEQGVKQLKSAEVGREII